MDVVTIATYVRPEEAHLARLRLCREDIPAFVVEDTGWQLIWTWTLFIGSARLLVAESDIESAIELLRNEPVVSVTDARPAECPHCGAVTVKPYVTPYRLAIPGLVLGWPLVLFARWHRWQCGECGNTWR
jgi:hypothetical protein